MNRAERRKNGLKNEAVYTLTESQIRQMKQDATNTAIDTAFVLMLGIPVYILHDHYPQIMKREENGKGREERFTDLILEHYEDFQNGLFTLADVRQLLLDECGLNVDSDSFRRRLI